MTKPPLRLAIAGLGTVGAEVARQITDSQGMLAAQAGRAIQITAVSARDKSKNRGVDLSGAVWVNKPADLVMTPNVDAVIELMGGADGAALDLARATLHAGKPLITANKAMLAAHWSELFEASARYHAPIMFEAAVCGGIPIIKVLREGLAGNRITRIEGILNGTCNYILSTMDATGREFADVLKEAQDKGYAEADPTLDVDGWDAAHKLTILAKLAFDPRITLDSIAVSGIRAIKPADLKRAREQGMTIRLIGRAEKAGGELRLSVAAVHIPLEHPLASVGGAMNAVTIKAEPVDECTLIGPGAGAGPTASAVLSDIIDVARKV
jgi:homoserine dehydrogenase